MTPGQVPVDPASPESNLIFKAPEGCEDWCGDLHVRITCLELDNGVVSPAGFLSEWWPSHEELVLLNSGQPVRTHIAARALPPQAVWVRAFGEV